LLHLAHLFGEITILGVGVFGGLDEELDAAGVGPDDAEAAVACAIILVQLLERRCDERLPEPHLRFIGERATFNQPDRSLIDPVALGSRVTRFSRRHLDEIESFELMFLR
jgi:hypothetical protein